MSAIVRSGLLAVVFVVAFVAAVAEPVHSAFTARTGSAAQFEAVSLFAPRNVTEPRISGTAREGQTLTVDVGTWVRGNVATSVQWQRCAASCSDVSGATSTSYVVRSADVGLGVRVEVTATNATGKRTVATEVTTAVAPGPPVNTAPPIVGGALTIGDVLTAQPGTWSGSPAFRYRWLRCSPACAVVDDGPTYLLSGADAGATVKLEVTATNDAGQATATSSPTAPIGRGTYTHVLCAHPDTGLGTGVDGWMQDGTDVEYHHAAMGAVINDARCGKGIEQTMSRGIPITTAIPFTTSTPSYGTALKYRAPADLEYTGATLFRKLTTARGWDAAVHRSATVRWLFATPFDERCVTGDGCTGHGVGTTPFSIYNRMGIGGAAGVNGFNIALLCNIPDSSRSCGANGTETYRVFGGKVSLRDTQTPTVDSASGSLLTSQALTAQETLHISARDQGAGLYRVRVRLGDTEVAAKPLGGETCRDVAPGLNDDYEFAVQKPCPATASSTMTFDTTSWPRGEHVLRVVVEDAGRNSVVVQRRTVTL